MKGHSCDFPMYTFLISLNAFDPPLNDWLSECVHHDTDPFQLLRSNRCLPMDRIVGNSIGYVMIHTPHELWYSHLCTSEPLPTIIRSPQQSGVHIYFMVYIFIFKPVVLGKITTTITISSTTGIFHHRDQQVVLLGAFPAATSFFSSLQ